MKAGIAGANDSGGIWEYTWGNANYTAFADFNGDGLPDIFNVDPDYGVGAVYLSQGGFAYNAASVLSNNGASDQNPAIPAYLDVCGRGRLYGDGKTDFVAFNEASSQGLQIVTGVNQGNGTFKWIPALDLPPIVASIGISTITADFNKGRQGRPDPLCRRNRLLSVHLCGSLQRRWDIPESHTNDSAWPTR